jgi:hypothetical protein
MSVGVDVFSGDDLYQAKGIQGWVWSLNQPADRHYWSLAVVPELANVAVCQLLRFWWSTDNTHEFHLTAFFDVQADGGNGSGIAFGIKAIRA